MEWREEEEKEEDEGRASSAGKTAVYPLKMGRKWKKKVLPIP